MLITRRAGDKYHTNLGRFIKHWTSVILLYCSYSLSKNEHQNFFSSHKFVSFHSNMSVRYVMIILVRLPFYFRCQSYFIIFRRFWTCLRILILCNNNSLFSLISIRVSPTIIFVRFIEIDSHGNIYYLPACSVVTQILNFFINLFVGLHIDIRLTLVRVIPILNLCYNKLFFRNYIFFG